MENQPVTIVIHLTKTSQLTFLRPFSTSDKFTIEKYKRSYLLKGDTKPFRNNLKQFGRWNPTLKSWVFGSKRKNDLINLFPNAEVKETV